MTEPLYQESHWCAEYLSGLRHEANRNAISLTVLDTRSSSVDEKNLQGNQAFCVLLGSSPIWLREMAGRMRRQNILSIFINPDGYADAGPFCEIHIDYYQAMRLLAEYFIQNRRTRTVLFLVNPDSSTDLLKANAFRSAFQNGVVSKQEASLSDSCEQFLTKFSDSDSVICCNDLVAIALLKSLQKSGDIIPKKIWMVTFGKSTLLEYTHPRISSIQVEYQDVGRHVVKIAQFLARNPGFETLSGTITASLVPSETTDSIPHKAGQRTQNNTIQSPYLAPQTEEFYQDQTILDLIALERLFANMLPIDLDIFKGLMENRRYGELAEGLGISENTVKYRIKRMLGIARLPKREDLIRLLVRYIS